jgi:hypothetical protein
VTGPADTIRIPFSCRYAVQQQEIAARELGRDAELFWRLFDEAILYRSLAEALAAQVVVAAALEDVASCPVPRP